MKIKKNIQLKPIPKMICLALAVLFCALTEGSRSLSQILIFSVIAIGFAILPCISIERVLPYTRESGELIKNE